MKLSLIIILGFIACIVVVLLLGKGKGKSNSDSMALAEYGKRPTHPNFPRVVVTIDGCSGDIDATIKSILSQSIQVSEITTGVSDEKSKQTCEISNLCKSVLNRYKDPYNKGTVKSTFERELEADTIVVFVKRGYIFTDNNELKKFLDKWTPGAAVETKNISVMNGNQC